MLKLTAQTFICPQCRKKVEVKVRTQFIRCIKCSQTMVSAKSQQDGIFKQ